MLLLFAIVGGCTGGGRLRVGDEPDTAPPPAPVLPAFYGDAPKNLLMLSVDTLRRDHVAPHGSYTPFLDSLVAEGFVLDDFTACSSWTTASAACVTSGATTVDLAPARGMIPIMFDGVLADIPSPEPMLASWLGDAGYSSLLVTSNAWFGAAYGNAQGYDRIRTPGHVRTEAVWDDALRAIDPAQGGTPLASPFYLHLHFFEPHRPYTAPPEYILGLEELPPIEFDLSTADGQEEADVAMGAKPPVLTLDEVEAIQTSMRLRYAGEVRWLDDGLRTVWGELDAQGLLDDTLVVFWTDHGEELWEHGPPGHGYLLHRGENDAAAFFWAKNIVPGTWAGPTQGIDLTPTVLELFGIERPPGPTGYPVGTAPADRARFALTDAHLGPIQTVRRGSSLMHFRWTTGGPESGLEVYDLATDPGETNNLYDPAVPPSEEIQELWSLLRPQIEAAEPWIADDPRGWSIGWPPGLPERRSTLSGQLRGRAATMRALGSGGEVGRHIALVLLLACNGGSKDDHITPLDDADADTDTDSDTDADTDADTDTGAVDPCAALPPASGATVDVSPGPDLAAAIAAAAPGSTLLLADGTYSARTTIVIDKALTLRSESGDRDAVIIDGEHVAGAGNLIEITASDVTIAHLTIQSSYDDLVHVQPAGAPITGVRLHDLHLLDPGRVALQIEGDAAENYADDGELTCSLVELTDLGRLEVRGTCDTGGVDAYGARGWVVRDNEILNFWCAFGQSRPGIRFFRGARDTLITRNVVGDASFGIVLGETQDAIGRLYDDDPCGGQMQSIDGVVTNNIVFAYDDDLVASDAAVFSGIRIESSCNAQIVHNSVYSAVAPAQASIEHRYRTTTGVLANNMASFVLRRLDDSELEDVTNVENATTDSWYYPADGDFHTSPAADWAIDQGSIEHTVTDDIDGMLRTDGLPDIGADER